MRKWLTILLTMVFALSFSLYGSACTNEKEAKVFITATTENVRVGDTVILTAAAEKYGSSYADSWGEAEDKGTTYDHSTHLYTSTAVFTAKNPGTYTITYRITMQSGHNGMIHFGKATRIITVEDPLKSVITITGVEIRDLLLTRLTNSDGTVSGYFATGNVYTLWSNNTSTLYGTIGFLFGSDESTKDVNVTIDAGGQAYSFIKTVTR